jgi:hypothetical protein
MDAGMLNPTKRMITPGLYGNWIFETKPIAAPTQKYADGSAESAPIIFIPVGFCVMVSGANTAMHHLVPPFARTCESSVSA